MKTRIRILMCYVFSVVSYGCETCADVNSNYDIMFNQIHRVVEKHISRKTVKFNKYKHKISKWITHGVRKSIKYRDQLHKILKMTPHSTVTYTTQQIYLKTYNSILEKKPIRTAKSMYYESTFNSCKHNIRNTWQTIIEIISKSQKKE